MGPYSVMLFGFDSRLEASTQLAQEARAGGRRLAFSFRRCVSLLPFPRGAAFCALLSCCFAPAAQHSHPHAHAPTHLAYPHPQLKLWVESVVKKPGAVADVVMVVNRKEQARCAELCCCVVLSALWRWLFFPRLAR